MAHTSTTISSPVRLQQDVWPVLGKSGGLGYVISNAAINKWAANKPIPHTSKAKLTHAQKNATARGIAVNWYKNGVTTPENVSDGWASVDEMLAGYSNYGGSVLWEYDRPTTTFRLLDFDGYHSEALPFINLNLSNKWEAEDSTGNLYVPDIIVRKTLDGSSYVDTVADSGGISPFSQYQQCTLGHGLIGQMYLGVAVINSSGTLVYLETYDNAIANMPNAQQEIEVPNFGTASAWYRVFLFLSELDLSSDYSTLSARQLATCRVVPFHNWFARRTAIINDVERQVTMLVALKQDDLYTNTPTLTMTSSAQNGRTYTFQFAGYESGYGIFYCDDLIFSDAAGLGASCDIYFQTASPQELKPLTADAMSGNWLEWNVTAMHSCTPLSPTTSAINVECDLTDSSTKPEQNAAFGIIISR